MANLVFRLLSAAALLLSVQGAAIAIPITTTLYQFTNVVFSNGDVVTGTFDFTTSTSTFSASEYSNVNVTLTTSGGTKTTYDIVAANKANLSATDLTLLVATNAGSYSGEAAIEFKFGTSLNIATSTDTISTTSGNTKDGVCNATANCTTVVDPSVTLTSGSLSLATVPEPASIGIVGLGIVGLMGMRRKRLG